MRAFTLVELAIVLVIIGLLTAGVVGARSLIESSKATSIAADFNKYATAYRAFYLEYNSMPGDMKNAYDYFGTQCGTNDTSGGGCNGDGNKYINWRWGAPRECRKLSWAHLYFANIVPDAWKSYTTNDVITIGTNFPKTAVGNASFMFCSTSNMDPPAWGGWNTVGFYGRKINQNFLTFFNNLYNPLQSNRDGPAVSAKMAKQIDEKFDDGKPDQGKMYVTKGLIASGVESAGCVDKSYRSVQTNVQWVLSNDGPDCMIHVEMETY